MVGYLRLLWNKYISESEIEICAKTQGDPDVFVYRYYVSQRTDFIFNDNILAHMLQINMMLSGFVVLQL